MYSTDGKFIKDTYIYGVGSVPSEQVVSSNDTSDVESIKVGASIHKEIRRFIRPHLKPGLKLSELANLIENKCVELTDGKGVNSGIGFPSSLSVTPIIINMVIKMDLAYSSLSIKKHGIIISGIKINLLILNIFGIVFSCFKSIIFFSPTLEDKKYIYYNW